MYVGAGMSLFMVSTTKGLLQDLLALLAVSFPAGKQVCKLNALCCLTLSRCHAGAALRDVIADDLSGLLTLKSVSNPD